MSVPPYPYHVCEFQALKCFEGSDNLVAVRRGMAFLLCTQHVDGAWTASASSSSKTDSARTYFATMSALRALSEPSKLGFAPAIPDVALLLERHLNADIVSEANPHREERAVNSNARFSIDSCWTLQDEMLKAAEASRAEKAAQSESTTSELTELPSAPVTEDLETQVRFQQSLLENEGGNVKNVSAKLATHVLSTLSGLTRTLTVDILKSTGIGRTINKLRKHASPEVAKAAGQLVAKWKKDLL